MAEADDRLGRTADADAARRSARPSSRRARSAPRRSAAAADAARRRGRRRRRRRRSAPLLESRGTRSGRGRLPRGRVVRAPGLRGRPEERRGAPPPRRRGARASGRTPTRSASSPPRSSSRPATPRRSSASASSPSGRRSGTPPRATTAAPSSSIPKSVAAARGLGRSMGELGDKSAARIAFGRAIEIDPASADARNDFGVFLFRSDELDRAIEELMEAVRLDPAAPRLPREPRARLPQEGHVEGGRARARRGGAPRAERDAASGPRSARCGPSEKKLDEAAAAFATALTLDPLERGGRRRPRRRPRRRRQARGGRGRAREGHREQHEVAGPLEQPRRRARAQRGNYAGGVEAFQKALALDAGFEAAKTNLARADRARGAREGGVLRRRAPVRRSLRLSPRALRWRGLPARPAYAAEIEAWRRRRVASLTAEDGWLPSSASSGSRRARTPSAARRQPRRCCPRHGAPRGSARSTSAERRLAFDPAPARRRDGRREARPDRRRDRSDADGEPTDARRGGPLRSTSSSAAARFARARQGLARARRGATSTASTYFPIDPAWRIEARFEPYDPPRSISVPNVLGHVDSESSPGALVFDARRQDATASTPCSSAARPTTSSIFGDATNGTRHLRRAGASCTCRRPWTGRPCIDFNKAYNPPCVFTPYATCPLPPPQNKLPIRVEAGEKEYAH